MDEKAAAINHSLLHRSVDGGSGFGDKVFVINIGDNADDAVRRHVDKPRGSELQHGIGPINVAINGILIGEHALRERFADDRNGVIRSPIIIVEVTTGKNRNTERGKKSGREGARVRARISVGSVSVTISRELDTKTGKTVAPGNHVAKRGAVRARQRVNAVHRFLVEIKDLLVRFAVGHGGNVNGEDVTRVETSPRSLQRD